MDMVIAAGKSRKNVDAYILLPPDCKRAIDLLIATRDDVKVPKSNPFVFARLNANTPLTGTKELRDTAHACPGLAHADRIKSTSLRRYIATVSQVHLNLSQHLPILVK